MNRYLEKNDLVRSRVIVSSGIECSDVPDNWMAAVMALNAYNFLKSAICQTALPTI